MEIISNRNHTLIVGGGPAGASCAWKLAKNRIPCILIDKADFPREKVCGGALSGGASESLVTSGIITGTELDRLSLKMHRTLSLFSRGELLGTYTSQGDPVRIISRLELDSTLLEKAASAGAEIITGDAVVSIEGSSVSTASGRKICFSNLVGADGCNSIVSKFLHGRKGRGTGIGLEYKIPLSDLNEVPENLQIHFSTIPYGYIWVFPDSMKVNIGAGAVGSKASPSDIHASLEAFLEAEGISTAGYRLQGAPLPSLSLDRKLGKGNIYLAGDAAGLVDQVSGEGIGHAIQSGFLVAECILSGGHRRDILRKRNPCISTVRQSIFYRHLLFSRLTHETAMMKLGDNTKFIEGYWNIISGRESYNDMFSRLLN